MKALSFEEVEAVAGGLSAFEAGEFCARVVGQSVLMIGVAIGIAAGAIYAIGEIL